MFILLKYQRCAKANKLTETRCCARQSNVQNINILLQTDIPLHVHTKFCARSDDIWTTTNTGPNIAKKVRLSFISSLCTNIPMFAIKRCFNITHHLLKHHIFGMFSFYCYTNQLCYKMNESLHISNFVISCWRNYNTSIKRRKYRRL